jgi:hypothetical protein
MQAELARELERFPSSSGSTAGWFITVATTLFVLMILAVAGVLVLLLFR